MWGCFFINPGLGTKTGTQRGGQFNTFWNLKRIQTMIGFIFGKNNFFLFENV